MYRRCGPKDIDDNGIVLPDRLRIQDMSVVRSDLALSPDDARWLCKADIKAGRAEYEEKSWVFAFPASAVPHTATAENEGRTFRIAVVHVPCDDLYPHCEVRFYVGDHHVAEEKGISNSVKKKVRQKISDSVAPADVWKPTT